jgi:D-alanyl-D-alanine dipeptidase
MLRCFLFVCVFVCCLSLCAAAQSIPDNCKQLIVVQADSWNTVPATLQCYERTDSRSTWRKAGKSFRVVLGKNGIAWDESQSFRLGNKTAPMKKEGDGKAPAGIFPLLYAYGYDTPQQQWKFPYVQVNEQTLCIDDPQSRYYNQVVSRDSIAQADWKSYEDMRRKDELYRLGLIVGYNTQPVQAGKGSCIFMHISTSTPQNSKGTAGCTAMSYEEILQILNWLNEAHKPMLIQMPAAEWRLIKGRLKIY